jgi:hypothetical protein
MSKSENLTPTQAKLVAQLLTGCTVRAAAKACGIVDKTAFNYLNLPQVKAALAEGIEEIKRHGIQQITVLAPLALGTIVEIMNDETAQQSVRLRAAHILASRLTDVKPAETPALSGESKTELDYSLLDNDELKLLMMLFEKAKKPRLIESRAV